MPRFVAMYNAIDPILLLAAHVLCPQLIVQLRLLIARSSRVSNINQLQSWVITGCKCNFNLSKVRFSEAQTTGIAR
jgi:hypothetical protein